MKSSPEVRPPKQAERRERAARLAQELRRNLRKRKDQERARRQDVPRTPGSDEPG